MVLQCISEGIFSKKAWTRSKGRHVLWISFTNNALIKVNTESEYVGDLAAEWEIDASALTYTFKLREGVKFHDGSDFTAEDVVFTYDKVKGKSGVKMRMSILAGWSLRRLWMIIR